MGTLSLERYEILPDLGQRFSLFRAWYFRAGPAASPDIKDALHLNEAVLGSVLFALPVGQLSAMALSGYLVSRHGSKLVLTVAALLYPAALVGLRSGFVDWTAHAGTLPVRHHGQPVQHRRQHAGSRRRTALQPQYHGVVPRLVVAGRILRRGLVSTLMVGYDIPPLMHFCIIYAVILRCSSRCAARCCRATPSAGRRKKKKVFVRPDRYILLLGLIAFGSMACEGTMFDWSGVYFETVIRPPKELIRLGYTPSCARWPAAGSPPTGS